MARSLSLYLEDKCARPDQVSEPGALLRIEEGMDLLQGFEYALAEALGALDALVAAGIRGILNFAPVVLRLPPPVRLVSVDLSVQLEQLAFLVQMSAAETR